MSIITLSEALLQKLPQKDGLILRDRILCGLCIRIGRRSRTFLIATSVGGKQLRMTLGRWPLISVEEARALAAPILKNCRNGQTPLKQLPPKLPTVAEYLSAQIALSEKSQREIAAEIGYENPNVVSMLKTGQTKVPINKVGPLAKALGLDPVFFLRLGMQEYLPETWEAIESVVKGTLLTANELELIRMYREISDNTDALPIIEDRDGTPVIALYAHMTSKTTRASL